MSSETTDRSRMQDSAFILHSRAYRNTSMIIDVFTREHGRLGLVAKGARRPASNMYGILQPFHCLFVHWGGHGELKTLYTAESEQRTDLPSLTGERVFLGFYINELMVRLLHHEEAHTTLFENYRNCMKQLARDADAESALRYFELELLDELGYGLNLTRDYQTDDLVQAESTYVFHPERGLTNTLVADKQQLSIIGETALALSEHSIKTDRQRREAKLLLRGIIEYHLDGRPLKTRELLQQKQQMYKTH